MLHVHAQQPQCMPALQSAARRGVPRASTRRACEGQGQISASGVGHAAACSRGHRLSRGAAGTPHLPQAPRTPRASARGSSPAQRAGCTHSRLVEPPWVWHMGRGGQLHVRTLHFIKIRGVKMQSNFSISALPAQTTRIKAHTFAQDLTLAPVARTPTQKSLSRRVIGNQDSPARRREPRAHDAQRRQDGHALATPRKVARKPNAGS